MAITLAFHCFALAALVFYSLSFWGYFRFLFGRSGQEKGAFFLKLALLAHLFFALVYFFRGGKGHPFAFDFADSLNCIALLVAFLYFLLERRLAVYVLGAVVVPTCTALMLGAGVLFHVGGQAYQTLPYGFALLLHIAGTLVGDVLFILSFSVSALLLLKQKMLKSKRLGAVFQKLPSLKLLDDLNGKLLNYGFITMLLGLAFGFYIAILQHVPFFGSSIRVYWSVALLTVYALLVYGRAATGLSGARAAFFSAFGFALLIASFVGVHTARTVFHVH